MIIVSIEPASASALVFAAQIAQMELLRNANKEPDPSKQKALRDSAAAIERGIDPVRRAIVEQAKVGRFHE